MMAPMFLVSNVQMLKIAMDEGVLGAIPSLNFLNDDALDRALFELKTYSINKHGSFAVNLIIKNNKKYETHLSLIVKHKVPIVITSLGDPSELIEKVQGYGGKVLCDVTNVKHAEKAKLADGFVAVGQGAGGHAGPISLQVLLPALRRAFPNKLILGAGGVATKAAYKSVIALGADGVSAGTVFIATKESEVDQAYKDAIIKAKASDITLTKILSGTPSTVIRSGYLETLEQQLKDQKLSLERGIELLNNKGIDADYKRLFVAGQAVEFVDGESSVSEVIKSLVL